MPVQCDDIIVIGSGVAGLVCALSMAPQPVTLITKTSRLQGGSSLWAQGGIAAAIGPGDSPEAHARDTLAAGAGLSDPERTRRLTEEGAATLQWLIDEGIPFDRDLDGALALAQEGAHRFPRVVHAGGDTTGAVLVDGLASRVAESPSVQVLDNTFAYDLVVDNGRVAGVITFDPQRGWVCRQARAIILATGGVGMCWWRTTNPAESTGDGLAMAARAGAKLADLEFVQFHPTALDDRSESNGASLPLFTEALRGAGAWLLDEHQHRFMLEEHPDAELAPRDVVARAIHRRTREGQKVYLDLRPVLRGDQGDAFPQAMEFARRAGLDASSEPVPVTPAAHYHMGGVQVQRHGRTSIPGLWACGEVATTGIHGANRLASNSLLEALVFAHRVADDAASNAAQRHVRVAAQALPQVPTTAAMQSVASMTLDARRLMSQQVGIVRTGDGLETAVTEFARLSDVLHGLNAPSPKPTLAKVTAWGEVRNMVLVSRLVAGAALQRTESRGAHFRGDFPQPKPEWQRAQAFTARSLIETH